MVTWRMSVSNLPILWIGELLALSSQTVAFSRHEVSSFWGIFWRATSAVSQLLDRGVHDHFPLPSVG
jgi:hypothetical protein